MMAQAFRSRLALALLTGVGVLLFHACSLGPTDFETQELEYKDTLLVQLPSQQPFIVLEQLADGPVDRYLNVAYNVRSADLPSGMVRLLLDVTGLTGKHGPSIFKESRIQEDTLYVWYADAPRANVVPESAKNMGYAAVQTSPPDFYVKVKHVTIEVSQGTEVRFSNRFIR